MDPNALTSTDTQELPPDERIKGGAVVLDVDLSVMSERSLLAAAHRLTGRADVAVEAAGGTLRKVTLRSRSRMTDLRELGWEFDQILIDETLRERIRQETDPIRAVLIAQAFSRTNLMRPDLDEVDPETDPDGIGIPDRLKQSPSP